MGAWAPQHGQCAGAGSRHCSARLHQQLSEHFSAGWGGHACCSRCFVHWGQRRGSVKCSRSQQKRGYSLLPALSVSVRKCCVLIRFCFLSCWTGAPALVLVANFLSAAAAWTQQYYPGSLQPWPAATSTHCKPVHERIYIENSNNNNKTGLNVHVHLLSCYQASGLVFQQMQECTILCPFKLLVVVPVTVFCGLNHHSSKWFWQIHKVMVKIRCFLPSIICQKNTEKSLPFRGPY